jgi:hypothetical protein
LGEAADPISIRESTIGQYIMDQVCHLASFVTDNKDVRPIKVDRVEANIHPEFISRFSFELGLRENRLVAWPGSNFVFSLNTKKNFKQLALASLLGIGFWNYWGFGRFDFTK